MFEVGVAVAAMIGAPLLLALGLFLRRLDAAPPSLDTPGFAPGERAVARVAQAVFGAQVAVLIAAAVVGPDRVVLGRWIDLPGLAIDVGLRLDAPGLALATLAAGWCWVAARASADYLHRETGFDRFYLGLALFGAGMQLIALGADLLWIFCGWELVGSASALLIGWRHVRRDAAMSGVRALLTNKPGDVGLLVAIGALHAVVGTSDLDRLAAHLPGALAAAVAGGGLLVAAAAKSGQPPFSPWLARAMEGPTPSSALFYGAVMVHAGPFLVLRAAPALDAAPVLAWGAVVVGAVGVVYGGLTSATQADVKSALVHAALAQAGVTMALAGLGLSTLACVHFVGHGLLRGWQLASSPSYRLLVDDEPVRPAAAWLRARPQLQRAAAARFWLAEAHAVWVVEPIRHVARRLSWLDADVVDEIGRVSVPVRVASSALADWEVADLDHAPVEGEPSSPLGRLLHGLAVATEMAEQAVFVRLLGDWMPRQAARISARLEVVERLLAEPWVVPTGVLLWLAVSLGGGR
jgi:hypothetical protein